MDTLAQHHQPCTSTRPLCLHLPLAYCTDFGVLEDLAERAFQSKEPKVVIIDGQPAFLFLQSWPSWNQSQWQSLSDGQVEKIPIQTQTITADGLLRFQAQDLNLLGEIGRVLQQGESPVRGSLGFEKLREGLKQDENWAKKAIFPLNNESLENHWQKQLPKGERIQNIYLTASGLKPLTILSAMQERGVERIVFYDLSPVALDFYKSLLGAWPFRNLDQYLLGLMKDESQAMSLSLRAAFALPMTGTLEDTHHRAVRLAVEREMRSVLEIVGSYEQLRTLSAWIKSCDLRFQEMDLLAQPEALPIFPGSNFLWVSNILSYRPTFFRAGGSKGLRRSFDQLLKRLNQTDEPSYLWGDLRVYGADWFSSATDLGQHPQN